MNLRQIVAAVENELQYAVETERHREDFRARVNDVYKALCRSRRWPWLYRKAALWVLPDLAIDHTLVNQPFPVEGPRAFEISRSGLYLAMGLTQNELTAHMLGQFANGQLDIADRTQGDGNWEKAPFVIESFQVVPPDASIVGFPTLRFVLDPRAEIDSIDDTEGEWLFSFPRVQLPVELDALECIRDEDGNVLRSVTPQEERLYLTQQLAGGTPYYVLEDYGFDMTGGFQLAAQNVHGGAAFEHTPFAYQTENWPLEETIALATLDPTTGNVAVGTVMRVFASWYYSNRFGPPSNIAEFTVDDFQGVKVTGLPVLPDTGSGTFEYGRRVAIFAAEGEGAFYFRGFVPTATATTFNITEPQTSSTAYDIGLRLPRWDELYPGQYQYIRVNPRADTVQRLTCEYWKRPRELIQDTDVPEFHEAFHRLLVWMTVEELVGGRYGGDPAFRRLQVLREKEERALVTRYFPKEQNQERQKGMIGQMTANRPLIGVDWNGDS